MKILTIARFTFREARRRRLLWLGIGLGLAFLALFGLGFYFIYDEIRRSALIAVAGTQAQQEALRVGANFFLMMGLFVVNFLVVLVSILTTANTLSGEISARTIQSIVTKPLRRWEIVLGKWLGHALMDSAYILLLVGGIILVVYLISGHTPRAIWAGLGLYLLEGWVLMSLSILGGTRLSTLANGVLIFMIYGLALIGGWVEQFATTPLWNSQAAANIGALTGRLLPSEALWRRASHIMAPRVSMLEAAEAPPIFLFTFGRAPAPSISLYALLYIAVVLGLAIFSFRRRDL